MSAAAGGGVLAELAWLSEWLSDTTPQGGEAAFETVRQAHSAVAELIAADKEYDEADAQYTVAEQMYGEDSNHPEMRKARGRIIRAVKRRRAALSNIEGASHGKAQRIETLNAIAAYAALAALAYTLATLHTTPGIVAAGALLALSWVQER